MTARRWLSSEGSAFEASAIVLSSEFVPWRDALQRRLGFGRVRQRLADMVRPVARGPDIDRGPRRQRLDHRNPCRHDRLHEGRAQLGVVVEHEGHREWPRVQLRRLNRARLSVLLHLQLAGRHVGERHVLLVGDVQRAEELLGRPLLGASGGGPGGQAGQHDDHKRQCHTDDEMGLLWTRQHAVTLDHVGVLRCSWLTEASWPVLIAHG